MCRVMLTVTPPKPVQGMGQRLGCTSLWAWGFLNRTRTGSLESLGAFKAAAGGGHRALKALSLESSPALSVQLPASVYLQTPPSHPIKFLLCG